MPRRREVPKREILPDPKFGNVDVAKFVNVLMLSGKKSVAENFIYGAFEQIQTKSGKDPLEVFAAAIGNCKPMVEVKSRRVGGANYQVPVEVRPVRRMALSMRWLREADILSASSVGKLYVEDDGYNLVICKRGTDRPLIAIEYAVEFV